MNRCLLLIQSSRDLAGKVVNGREQIELTINYPAQNLEPALQCVSSQVLQQRQVFGLLVAYSSDNFVESSDVRCTVVNGVSEEPQN